MKHFTKYKNFEYDQEAAVPKLEVIHWIEQVNYSLTKTSTADDDRPDIINPIHVRMFSLKDSSKTEYKYTVSWIS